MCIDCLQMFCILLLLAQIKWLLNMYRYVPYEGTYFLLAYKRKISLCFNCLKPLYVIVISIKE
jgi:hypothetical protein